MAGKKTFAVGDRVRFWSAAGRPARRGTVAAVVDGHYQVQPDDGSASTRRYPPILVAGDIHQVRHGVLGALGILLCVTGAAVSLMVALIVAPPDRVVSSGCVVLALAFLVGASIGIRAIRTAINPLRPLPKPGDGESVWPGPF